MKRDEGEYFIAASQVAKKLNLPEEFIFFHEGYVTDELIDEVDRILCVTGHSKSRRYHAVRDQNNNIVAIIIIVAILINVYEGKMFLDAVVMTDKMPINVFKNIYKDIIDAIKSFNDNYKVNNNNQK